MLSGENTIILPMMPIRGLWSLGQSSSYTDDDTCFLLRALKLLTLCWLLENQSESLWYSTVQHFCSSLHVANKLLNKKCFMCSRSHKQSLTCIVSLRCVVCPSGPFVMTSEEEIAEAFRDYQTGTNGFERAKNWRSKIRGSFWTLHTYVCLI